MGGTPRSAEHSGQTLPQIAGCRTGERQAPGDNRTAIGPVYEKGAGLMYRLSGDWGIGMVLD